MTTPATTPALDATVAPTYHVARATRVSRAAAPILLIAAIVVCTIPWWGDRALGRMVTEFLYMLALAQMWNMLAGYTGLISVGQQAFVGLGGYVLVVAAMHLGINVFAAIPLAGIAAGIVALPAAAVLFRLRGPYFAVGTWVVAEVFMLLTANVSLVGGGSGTSITNAVRGIPVWWREAITFWIAAGFGIGSIVVGYFVLRSRYGLALQAIRDSEAASDSLGIGVTRMKWLVYVASAAGCGAIGALIFVTKLRISPGAAYSLDWTTTMFFIVVIGGIGTLEGPLLGALVFFIMRGLLADYGSWYMIVLGAIAVLVMLKLPEGLWGYIARRWNVTLFPVRRRLEPDRSPGE